jgi:nucleoside-diphosphate-sugar epimerase
MRVLVTGGAGFIGSHLAERPTTSLEQIVAEVVTEQRRLQGSE